MNILSIVALLLYAVVALLHLYGEYLLSQKEIRKGYIYRYITKPLLMPLLILFYIAYSSKIYWLLIIALIFAFLGDTALMIKNRKLGKISFIIGLSSFLMGHLFYIGLFVNISKGMAFYSPIIQILLILPFLFIALYVGKLVLPYAQKMKIPVGVYLIVITLMNSSSVLLISKLSTVSFICIYSGVTLFSISDSLNAYSRFIKQFKMASCLIMLTYILAQLFIVIALSTL